MNWFITGTDTGVGKTYVTQLLLKATRAAGMNAVPFKPICCGGREDAYALHLACDQAISVDKINPVWMRPAAAPYTASMIEERQIDLALARSTFQELKTAYPFLFVEGVGGWKVPITRDYTTADMAVEFALPVVLVIQNRLGAINHTLLTLESIKHHGLSCAGLILNHSGKIEEIPAATNKSILEEITNLPVLFEISQGQKSVTLAYV